MTFKLGLTGSIGMGKSTTARFFADLGCALWDADAAVHRLYQPGGAAVSPIGQIFPGAILDGQVSRDLLKKQITKDPASLDRLEEIVHPLVARDRQEFLERSATDITVFDIPLLFETGADKWVDAVVCVTAPADIQWQRVQARGTMSRAEFETILSKQMPDAQKRSRSDYIIVTDTLEHARQQVHSIVEDIRSKMRDA